MIRLPGKREFYREAFELLERIEEEAIYGDDLKAEIEAKLTELDKMLCIGNYTIPLIYIAGQYFPSTKQYGEKAGIQHWLMHQNIEKARNLGAEVVRKGWMPIIPHTNTAWMSGLAPHQWWYRSTNEQLRVCDAILMVPGWEDSTGAQMEHDEAVRMGINVYLSPEDVPAVMEFPIGKVE